MEFIIAMNIYSDGGNCSRYYLRSHHNGKPVWVGIGSDKHYKQEQVARKHYERLVKENTYDNVKYQLLKS